MISNMRIGFSLFKTRSGRSILVLIVGNGEKKNAITKSDKVPVIDASSKEISFV